jgi:ATP-binding cassette, subfamily B, bacterial CvaB/MchF/RaxB
MRPLSFPNLRFWHTQRLPLMLQTEAAECGLACLAMIATYWGHGIDLAAMRRRFSVSLKGGTLKSLVEMAKSLNLQARPLKLDLEQLSKLKLPCILHWDMNHFVVLKQIGGKKLVIHDPAIGERSFTFGEFSKHFTGVALELIPGIRFQKVDESRSFSLLSLMGHVVGLRRALIQLLLLGIALQVCVLVLPFYMQWIVDEALTSSDRDLIKVLGIGFLLLVIIQAVISSVRSWITTVLATDMNFQWLSNVFAHLLRLPLPYFEKRHLGDIVSRFGSIQTIQKTLTTQFVEGIIDGLLVMATLIVMLLYSVKLAAVTIVAVVLYVLLRWSLFRSLREATAEQIVHAAKQHTHFLESVRGIQSIRLFERAEERRIAWMNVLTDQFNADLRIARLSITYQTANTFLFGIERVVVILLAALAVLDGRFSVGMLFAFISYKDQFSQRIAALVDKLFELRMLRLQGERLADIVMNETERDGYETEVPADRIEACIEVRNLAFRYADGEPYVLKALNLTIPAGQCLAIAGASGSGKTTLVKLLLGLMEPTEGEILIGGIKLQQLGLTNYRRMIGTVMQDDGLFAGSIADNISFFDPRPKQVQIEECAEKAAIHHEIGGMPMGYNTLVGDIGTGLSGGQKQRILLARALYKNPKLLFLDEATSHLDIRNEQLVNEAIKQIQMTRIIVAHRPETIATAERVVVIEQGCLTDDFTQDLPRRNADCRHLVNPEI